MKRVSRKTVPVGVEPSARKRAGSNRASTPPGRPEPRREGLQKSPSVRSFSKGPTSEQWVKMAGAMQNALSALRSVSDFIRIHSDNNDGWVQPTRVDLIVSEIASVENILRVGLKARTR